MAQIKQIKVGGTTYDIEPASQTALSSTIVKDALGYTPVNKAGDTMTGSLFFNDLNRSIGVSNSKLEVHDSLGGVKLDAQSNSVDVTPSGIVLSTDSSLSNIELNTTGVNSKAMYNGNEIATTDQIDNFVAKTGDTMTGDLKLSSIGQSDPSPKISVEGGVGARLDIYDSSYNGATINRYGIGPLNITADNDINIQNDYDKNVHVGHEYAGFDANGYSLDIHTVGDIKFRSTGTAQTGNGIVFDNYRHSTDGDWYPGYYKLPFNDGSTSTNRYTLATEEYVTKAGGKKYWLFTTIVQTSLPTASSNYADRYMVYKNGANYELHYCSKAAPYAWTKVKNLDDNAKYDIFFANEAFYYWTGTSFSKHNLQAAYATSANTASNAAYSEQAVSLKYLVFDSNFDETETRSDSVDIEVYEADYYNHYQSLHNGNIKVIRKRNGEYCYYLLTNATSTGNLMYTLTFTYTGSIRGDGYAGLIKNIRTNDLYKFYINIDQDIQIKPADKEVTINTTGKTLEDVTPYFYDKYVPLPSGKVSIKTPFDGEVYDIVIKDSNGNDMLTIEADTKDYAIWYDYRGSGKIYVPGPIAAETTYEVIDLSSEVNISTGCLDDFAYVGGAIYIEHDAIIKLTPQEAYDDLKRYVDDAIAGALTSNI